MTALKDVELQKYYDAMLAMFASDGWAYLMEDAQKLSDELGVIEHATPETLGHLQGQRRNLDWLRGMRTLHEHAYAMLLEGQEDAEMNDRLFGSGRAQVIE